MEHRGQILFVIVLLAILVQLAIGQSSSSSSSSSYAYRLRRRCLTVFPTRQQLFYSNNIVLVGLVEQIKPLDDDGPNDPNGQHSSANYLANVYVRRVLHGQRQLQRTRIQVTGFNPPHSRNNDGNNDGWCYPNTRKGESWIFVLQPINPPEYYRLNSSLIKVTMNNLERLDAIIADQPYGLRSNIAELPCEKKYCKNNANCVNDPYSPEGARCECLTHCKTSKYEPVCASDDETYNNECEMRMRSCRANKNLFVKGMNSCYYFRPPQHHHYTSYAPARIDSSVNSVHGQHGQTGQSGQPGHRTSTTTTHTSYSRYNHPQDHRFPPPPAPQQQPDHYRSSYSSSYSSTSNRPQYPLPSDHPLSGQYNRWPSSSSSNHVTMTHITPKRSYMF